VTCPFTKYLVILLFQISGASRLPETTPTIHSFRSSKALAATTQAIVGPYRALVNFPGWCATTALTAPGISPSPLPRTKAILRLRTAAITPFIVIWECGDRFDRVHIGQDIIVWETAGSCITIAHLTTFLLELETSMLSRHDDTTRDYTCRYGQVSVRQHVRATANPPSSRLD
jgi:hypothetical protein